MTLLNGETASERMELDLTAALVTAVEEHRNKLVGLSQAIGNDPELAFEEHRASARVAELLEEAGFDVRRGAYGLPTAVEATYGSGEITVGIVGEYDALPEIGHACGHNIIAAAGVGASIALKTVADRLNLRVKFLGAPAEELGGGKILMLQRGAWDDVTFSLMVHGGPRAQLRVLDFSFTAIERLVATFRGRAAHIAMLPHEGINAGDAVTLAQVGLGLLRQQLRKTVVVGSYVAEAGTASNVTPDTGVLDLEIRAADDAEWADARARVRNVLQGAAIATGCELEFSQPEPAYAPLKPDHDLARCYDEAVTRLGYELIDKPDDLAGASTDMGNVSQYLPVIHPMIALLGTSAYPHHQDFADAALSPAGDQAVTDGALALALTTTAAVRDRTIRERLLADQKNRRPYVSVTT